MADGSEPEKTWVFRTQAELIGFLLAVLSIALGVVFWLVPPWDFRDENEDWYVGEWEVDIEKSMPELEKQYARFEEAFGKDSIELMKMPAPGEGVADSVFVFGKSAGQMVRRGTYWSKQWVEEGVEVSLGESMRVKGDADVAAYGGRSSTVRFELIQDTGPKTILRVVGHDMKLGSNPSPMQIPDGYIAKDGEGMLLSVPSFITKLTNCDDPVMQVGCDESTEWFESKKYLARLSNR